MLLVPGRTGLEGTRFHHTAQNYTQFKTYELFASAVFHFIFSGCSSPLVTETTERETSDKGGYAAVTDQEPGQCAALTLVVVSFSRRVYLVRRVLPASGWPTVTSEFAFR